MFRGCLAVLLLWPGFLGGNSLDWRGQQAWLSHHRIPKGVNAYDPGKATRCVSPFLRQSSIYLKSRGLQRFPSGIKSLFLFCEAKDIDASGDGTSCHTTTGSSTTLPSYNSRQFPAADDYQYSVRILNSVSEVPRSTWNALVGEDNSCPFLLYDWIHALEDSGCASPQQGWQPLHLLLYRCKTLSTKSHNGSNLVPASDPARNYSCFCCWQWWRQRQRGRRSIRVAITSGVAIADFEQQ